MTGIHGDEREIEAVWEDPQKAALALVGYRGVTKIEPYLEPGNGALVPWLKVWRDDRVYERLNCNRLTLIRYMDPEPEADDDIPTDAELHADLQDQGVFDEDAPKN